MATSMLRRDFILACGASALTASLPATLAGASPRFYSRALLVDPAGRPLKAGAPPANPDFLFHYPFSRAPPVPLNPRQPPNNSPPPKNPDQKTYPRPRRRGAGP